MSSTSPTPPDETPPSPTVTNPLNAPTTSAASTATTVLPDAASALPDSTASADPTVPTDPTAPTTKPKRHKSVRTAIRQLLHRSTSSAIGQMGDTEDGITRRAIGTHSMEIDTPVRPGHPSETKHVHVSVIMSVSDDPVCAVPFPPVVVVPPAPPTPQPSTNAKWWWLAVPLIALGLWTGSPQFKPVVPVAPTQAPTKEPAGSDSSKPLPIPVVSAPPAPVSTPAPAGDSADMTPAPALPPPTPTAPAGRPVKVDGSGGSAGGVNGGITGGINGGSPAGVYGLPNGTIGAAPIFGGLCSNAGRQFSTAPEPAGRHAPDWVKARAATWSIKRQGHCGVIVQVYDLCGHLLDVQKYGDGEVYLGQTLYARKGAQLQIDQLDGEDHLTARTTYITADTPARRVTLAYRFDAQLHRLFEARITRDNDGHLVNIALWSFGPEGQAAVQNTYVAQDEIAANVAPKFHQFAEFNSGNW